MADSHTLSSGPSLLDRGVACSLLAQETCADVPRHAWQLSSELLLLSNFVVELIPEEAEIDDDVWQKRALILMGHYNCHERPRALCMRAPDQMWEASKCMRKQARLIPCPRRACAWP